MQLWEIWLTGNLNKGKYLINNLHEVSHGNVTSLTFNQITKKRGNKCATFINLWQKTMGWMTYHELGYEELKSNEGSSARQRRGYSTTCFPLSLSMESMEVLSFWVELPHDSFKFYWVLLYHYNFAYLFLYYQPLAENVTQIIR